MNTAVSGLPALPRHPSKAEVEAFLAEHEATLWQYWRTAFRGSFASPRRFVSHDDALRFGSPERAATYIADRLVRRLKDPEITLHSAAPWEDLRTWYNWSVGKLMAARIANGGDRIPAKRWVLPDWVQPVVHAWCRTVREAAHQTRIPTFEAEWLYATVRQRREVAKLLRRDGDGSPWTEAQARGLLPGLDRQGGSNADRVARSRRGATTCLRFDILHKRDMLLQADALIAVFVGPVRDAAASPPMPEAAVDEALASALVAAAREMWALVEKTPRTRSATTAARLDVEVLARGLLSESTRIVPAEHRSLVAAGWPRVVEEEG